MPKLKNPFSQRNISKYAFTLAEVLITLGIIGIVAAMTIPSLISKTQNAEFVTGLKKAYSIISQATERVQQDEGDFSNWDIVDNSTDSTNTVFNYYKPYLNIIKDCGNDGNTGCWYWTKALNGSDNVQWGHPYGIGTSIRVFTLSDGMNVVLDILGTGIDFFGCPAPAIIFRVDVNGYKKPNQFGRDVFAFTVYNNKVQPVGIDDDSKYCVSTDNSTLSGMDCAAKVLREGKIDY